MVDPVVQASFVDIQVSFSSGADISYIKPGAETHEQANTPGISTQRDGTTVLLGFVFISLSVLLYFNF